MSATKRRLEVWKFGGAALADAAAIQRAAGFVADHDGPLVVTSSAVSGMTDLLLDGARSAAAGDAKAGGRVAAAVVRRHRALAGVLFRDERGRRQYLQALDASAREYRELARAVCALGDLSPRASALMVSRGERLSTALLAGAIAARGRRVSVVDATELIDTDGDHLDATPDLEATRRRVRRRLRPLVARGTIVLVPGFIGSAPDGSLTTLGRGGTDLTATLLGHCLAAQRVVLWKDVPGILTADPRAVPEARLIPQLHHAEAAEVAWFGAKVLHPRALVPLSGTRIELLVRSFLHPERPGTEVSARAGAAGYPVKALATIRSQALVSVAGKGLMGVPGMAARAFGAVHSAGLSVSTIFQAASESAIGFTLPEAQASRAVSALRRTFRDELARGLVEDVVARPHLAVVAVVGDGMAGTRGLAARVFTAVAEGQVNVIAIAQGGSERNITFVVRESEAPEAMRRVHAAFQLDRIGGGRPSPPPHSAVTLLGFGTVGRALARQLAALPGADGPRIVGIVDRSGYVFEAGGLSASRVAKLARAKERGRSLVTQGGTAGTAAEALRAIARHALRHPALADVTAEDTDALLGEALRLGFDVVLANKRPVAGSRAAWERLASSAREHGRRLRYEATVGAGLPVIDTWRKLVESGDRVLHIDGCVSGTLGYVLSEVEAGRPFSEAVREAVRRGYAEPDPREDLGGADVARKGLILARLLGYRGAAPRPENLVPGALRRVSREAFLERLSELDADWAERVERAGQRGRVLRYVVEASPRKVQARLLEVPADDPLGALKGTRNLVRFVSRRYRDEPLIVSGPGAGPEVTAAGIVNDLSALHTES